MGRSTSQGGKSAIAWGAVLMLCIGAVCPAALASAQTRAGTVIVNTAAARHDDVATPSNAVAVIVAERLDVALASDPAASRPDTAALTLTNRGNGDEAFVIARTGPAAGAIAIVVNGAAPVLLAGGRTPVLAPGASVTLLVPVSPAVEADTVVTARAATGSGAPATTFAGQGDGGGDAVVGASGAAASVTLPFAGAGTAPTLSKSQAVAAPDGSDTPVHGARIAYTLVARFVAATGDAAIADPIPAGTAFAPGSLSLDGVPLAEAGHLDAGRLVVPLGAVAAGAVRTLRFSVVIL